VELTKPDWLPEKNWEMLDVLTKLAKVDGISNYDGLLEKITSDSDAWFKFYDDAEPIENPMPGNFDKGLAPIQRLLVVASLRQNLFILGVKRFIRDEIGKMYTESPPFDLAGSYAESSNTTPIIFVLSAGADPTNYLLKLA